MSDVPRQRFVITGADATTGEPMSLTVETSSVQKAAAAAERRGIRVAGVQAVQAAVDYATPAAGEPAGPLPAGWIICPNPNCGYTGPATRTAKGSTLTMVLLLMLAVLPGLIYAILYNGDVFVCPRCGAKAREE